MRCLSCDVILSDFEATRKYVSDETYVDLCNSCIRDLPIETIVRRDLQEEEPGDGYMDDWEDD